MSPRNSQCVLLFVLALFAGSASAAFNVSSGPIAIPNANTFVGFAFEVNFAASTGPENLTLTIDCSTNAGAVGFFTDVDRCSIATTAALWGQGELLVGSAGFAQGSQPTPYITPNYMGRTARFSIFLSPANAAGTFPCNFTVSLTNGAAAATGQLIVTPPPAFSQGVGLGPSLASVGTQVFVTNKMEPWYASEHHGALDRVEYQLEINFGAVPTTGTRNLGIYAAVFPHASVPPLGTGSLKFDFYDLSVDGFAQPSLSFNVAHVGTGPFNGGEDAKTYAVPAGLTGVHAFRVVVSGVAGMTPNLLYFLGIAVDSRLTMQPLAWTPADARNEIKIQSSGAGATITPDIVAAPWTSTETLSVTGGTTAPTNYTWSVVSPAWLGVTSATGPTTKLTVTGAVPAPGPVQVTVRVQNDFSVNNNSLEFVQMVFTVTVANPPPPTLTITTLTVSNGVVSTPYNQQIDAVATGGLVAPFVWTSAGTVPPGLSLNLAATGLSTTLSGSPTTAGTFNFSVTITKGAVNDSQPYTVVVDPAPPAPTLNITTLTLPGGQVGTSYGTQNINAVETGGLAPPFAWTTGGVVPTGLTVNLTATGLITTISGNPTVAGTFNFTVTVSSGAIFDTQAYMVTINPAPPPPLVINTSSLASAMFNDPYSADVTATGGGGTYTWSVQAGSNLPPGLNLGNVSMATATISGTPTVAGTYVFTLECTDGPQTDTQTYTLVVNAPPPPVQFGTSGSDGCVASGLPGSLPLAAALAALALAAVRGRRRKA